MGRWEPNARERLGKAALELFQEHGYSQTTVEEIAARAGLTERTFFRYFNDKREVLFGGSSVLRKLIAETIADAPKATAPLDAMAAALESTAAMLPRSREYARKRRTLIAAHADLRERELLKLTALASAAADALRRRGVAEPSASLTAEAGIAVFKVAFDQWIDDTKRRDLSHHIRAAVEKLKAVILGSAVGSPTSRAMKPSRPRSR